MKKLPKEYYSKKDGEILEKGIQRQVCEFLHENSLFFWRSNNIPVYGQSNDRRFRFRALPKFTMKGVPDIIVIYDGQFIGIEVKRKNKGLRQEQADFGVRCRTAGGRYIVVHSVDEVKEYFSSNFNILFKQNGKS